MPRCGWQTLWAPLRSAPGDQVSVSPWRFPFQELQPFSEIIKTFWNLQNSSFFSGRPAASRDRWVQGPCDHSGLSRVRPVDEVCQVLRALLISLSTTNDWNINSRPNLDKLFYSWNWRGWKCFVCKSTKHTSYLSREPRVYSCKFFLAGVNFYRFNAKNWHFRQILREKVAFFLQI